MTDDDAFDQTMSYPSDGYKCAVCGHEVVTYPEGIFHAQEWRDKEHAPVIDVEGKGLRCR